MLQWVAKVLILENPGIDPGTSRMQSGRSTIWANPPFYGFSTETKFTYLNTICLYCHFKTLKKHYMLLKYYSKNNLPDNVEEKKEKMLQSREKSTHLTLENPGIDPGTSRMLSGRSTIWANSPDCAQHLKLVTPVAVTEKIWRISTFLNLNRK